MANVFFSSAVDGIDWDKIKRKYKRIEKALQVRKHRLLNPPGIYLNGFRKIQSSDAYALSTAIVENDLQLLRQADVLLVDVSIPNHTYIGCICEMVYAREWGIPVVSYIGRNHIGKRPFFIYHSNTIYKRWADALDHIGV
jgi:hypothetical protein